MSLVAGDPSGSGPPGGTPALGWSPGTRMVAWHSDGGWVGGGWRVYPARDLLWVTVLVDPGLLIQFRVFQTQAG